jgi:hypothetical protein
MSTSVARLGHQPRLLEQAQVPRHGGPADRQLPGEFAHRPLLRLIWRSVPDLGPRSASSPMA